MRVIISKPIGYPHASLEEEEKKEEEEEEGGDGRKKEEEERSGSSATSDADGHDGDKDGDSGQLLK